MYIKAVTDKYIHCKNLVFDCYCPGHSDTTLVLGRSQITLSWKDFDSYNSVQQSSLKKLFGGKVISVYSENHPFEYPIAVEFYSPQQIIDLCDWDVYSNGTGKHFEKRINFDIYKPIKNNIEFQCLFLGTNKKYYNRIQEIIHNYPDHGIITYNESYIDRAYNNLIVPVDNLLGKFETYVYTKDTFDPAPRLVQECKYFDKQIDYCRPFEIKDGGKVYYNREIKEVDVCPILECL